MKRELAPAQRAPAGPEPRYEASWRGYRSGTKSFGSLKGPIQIVEFMDFECPYCRGFASALDTLLHMFPGRVGVYFRSFPLSIHPHAKGAALAGECASAQGAFASYHDALFQHPELMEMMSGGTVPRSLGIPDTARFAACLTAPETAVAVSIDSLDGTRLRLSGTPLVMLNGWMFDGTPTVEQMRNLIERERLLKQ